MRQDVLVVLRFDVRASDVPLVDCVWRCRSTEAGELVSVASSHWHLVVGEIEGRTEVTVHGPETRATMSSAPTDATWVGIRFRLGTVLHDLSVAGLVDGGVTLSPPATGRSGGRAPPGDCRPTTTPRGWSSGSPARS